MFKCDACDFSTAIFSSLNIHKSKIHNVKVFKCKTCDFSTSYFTCLKRHSLKHLETPKLKPVRDKRSYISVLNAVIVLEIQRILKCIQQDIQMKDLTVVNFVATELKPIRT